MGKRAAVRPPRTHTQTHTILIQMRCPLNGTAVSRLRECHCRFLLPGGPRRPPVGLWGQAWPRGPARRRQPGHTPVPTKAPREAAGSASMGPGPGPITSPPGDAARHHPGSALGLCRVSTGTRPSPQTRGSLGKVRPAATLGSTRWLWEDAAPLREDPTAPFFTLCAVLNAHTQPQGRTAPRGPAAAPTCARGAGGPGRWPCPLGAVSRAGTAPLRSAACSWRRAASACLLLRAPCQGGRALPAPRCSKVRRRLGARQRWPTHGTAVPGRVAPSAHAMAATRRRARGHPMPTQGASPGAQHGPWGGTLPHASLHDKPCPAGAAVP